MAHEAYVSITGQRQGPFKSEGMRLLSRDQWIEVLSFSMGLNSSRDPITGQTTGRHQYSPVTLVKAWGAASPQGLTACATNEVLTKIVFEFVRTNPHGEEYVYQTVKLTNASLSQIFRFRGDPEATTKPAPGPSQAGDTLELERWSFNFQKIEVDDHDGETSFVDNWMAGV